MFFFVINNLLFLLFFMVLYNIYFVMSSARATRNTRHIWGSSFDERQPLPQNSGGGWQFFGKAQCRRILIICY
jgi:hypothetical protein